jgi:hypothetical protein
MSEKGPLVADLSAAKKVDVLQIWGSPALNVRRTLVADLLEITKGDVL